jgi:hypothetical protein
VASNYWEGIELIARLQNPQQPELSDRDQKLAQGLNAACDDFKAFFGHFKFVILIPLSWSLTLWHFAIVLTWGILASGQISFQRHLSD